MITLYDIIVLVLETILYTFHSSLVVVLIVKRKTKFVGPFYNMLRILFVSDIVLFLSTFEFRLAEYGFWKDYFKVDEFFATFAIHSTTYLFYLQFSIHALIPFNRFTLFFFPFLYKKIWSKHWYTVLIIFLPIIVLAPVLKERCIFVYVQNDTVAFPSLQNPDNTTFYLLIMLIYSGIMTVFAAIFNFLAILKYYFQRKYQNTNTLFLTEIPILYVSCATFIAHLFYCLVMVARITFNDNPFISSVVNNIWFVSTDLIAATGSISLIIICKGARKTYLQFYTNFNKKPIADSRIFTLSKLHHTVRPVSKISV